MKLRKLNRVTHRDIGYLITGLTIIYAISGVALNHMHDGNWNPNYIIEKTEISTDVKFDDYSTTDEMVLNFLDELMKEKIIKNSTIRQKKH